MQLKFESTTEFQDTVLSMVFNYLNSEPELLGNLQEVIKELDSRIQRKDATIDDLKRRLAKVTDILKG